jgi:3-hydroxyisobutyrate dehydrogenase
LANRFDLNPGTLLEALGDNPIASPYALAKLERMIDGDYHADFALDLALKDLELVKAEAGPHAAPVAAVMADRWRHLVEDGARGLDVSAAARGLAVAGSRND